MNRKDIITIATTVFIASIFSYVICSNFIFSTYDQKQQFEVVTPIDANFNLPDKQIFNTDAVNPTKLIEIGPNSNDQPFSN